MATNNDSDSENGDAGSPVRIISSIAYGVVEPPDAPRQISWSDFNALAEQTRVMQERTRVMQERINLLENQRGSSNGAPQSQEEKVGLLGKEGQDGLDFDEAKDAPRFSSRADDEAANGVDGTRHALTLSDVEKRYDEYELPESAYVSCILFQPLVIVLQSLDSSHSQH